MPDKPHIAKASKICSALLAGGDPESLMIDAIRAFRGMPDAGMSEVIMTMNEGGAAEVAVKFLCTVQHPNIEFLSSSFKAMIIEKAIHPKIAIHFDKLVQNGKAGEAMDFARRVDSEPFAAMEEAGCFDDDGSAGREESSNSQFAPESGKAEPESEDSTDKTPGSDQPSDLEIEDIYRALLEEIMSDGVITDVEKRFIGDLRRILKISGQDYSRIFNEVDKRHQAGELDGRNEADPVGVYRKIVRRALADGVVTTAEEEIMFSVAQSLLIDRDTHLRLMKEELPNAVKAVTIKSEDTSE